MGYTTRFLALLILFVGSLQSAFAAPMPFPDMEHSWYRYREAVDYLKSRGVIGGHPDGTFKPKDPVNRAELLKIIFTGRSAVTPATRRCFSDVNPDEWYAPYICSAANRNIVSGYPDGTFKPGQTVNFAEAIKMVLSAYGQTIEEGTGEHWYRPYVEELASKDILAPDSFLPWEDLNRERAADLIWRMLRFEEDRIIPRLSPGCGKAPPTTGPTTVTVYGQTRNFLLTIPDRYVAHDPVELIIAFHGRTNSNSQVRSYYRLDREATEAIIAYPAAVSNGNGSFSWSDPGDSPNELRDVRFFDAIVETLATQYCIDMDRIFVVGHSLGGWFANSVACVRGDVVRASAEVGGSSVITDCAGPAAAMIAHNPNDRLASFSGAERTRQLRVEQNFCTWDTADTGPSELKCVRHDTCSGDNDILWCPHEQNIDSQGDYYPHNWPRSTAQHIITFFRSLP